MDSTQDWRSSAEVDDDTFQQSLTRLSQQIAARRSAILVPEALPPAPREWKAWPFLLLIAVAGAASAGYYYAAFVEGDALPPRSTFADAATAPPAPVLAAVAVAPMPAAPPPAATPAIESAPTREVPAQGIEPVAAVPGPEPAVAAAVASSPTTAPEPDLTLTWAEILDVQKRLAALGINPGPLDGIVGPRTSSGVQRYEELHDLAVTGKVDRRLLQLLRADAAAAPTAISLEARAP